MALIIKRGLFWLWPPSEAWSAERAIDKGHKNITAETRWKSILSEVRGSLPHYAERDDLEAMAKQIQDSEAKRKETLENKAASFVSSIGITLGIISLAAALFTDKQMPKTWAIVFGCMYLLAIVHLFLAAYYAVKARRVAAFATLSADGFIDAMKSGQWKAEERIALTIGMAKWNEDALVRKSNWLCVAESLFLRGLFLASFAVVASMMIKLLVL